MIPGKAGFPLGTFISLSTFFNHFILSYELSTGCIPAERDQFYELSTGSVPVKYCIINLVI